MNFKLTALALVATTVVSTSNASTTIINNQNQGEKCKLVREEHDGKEKADMFEKTSAINIFGEYSIFQDVELDTRFPPKDTLISFSFENDPSIGSVGDLLLKSIQTTSFQKKSGELARYEDLDWYEPFGVIYTHRYDFKRASTSISLTATHTVVQQNDYWASKDVIVSYIQTESTPIGKIVKSGKMSYNCNEFDRAVIILKR